MSEGGKGQGRGCTLPPPVFSRSVTLSQPGGADYATKYYGPGSLSHSHQAKINFKIDFCNCGNKN